MNTNSLLGIQLLGNTFYQDSKQEWLKIDNVSIFKDYDTVVTSNDIGGILDKCKNDAKSVVLLYEWSTGKAYVKSSFNYKNGTVTDVISKSGCTTFVKKNVTIPAQPLTLPVTAPLTANILLGTKLLENTFYQDSKQEWLKIDNVSICKDYDTVVISNDIGGILDKCKNDNKSVVVLYEWNTGKIYIKSSFNYKNGTVTDIISKAGCTTFVKKNYNITPTSISTPPTQISQFVIWDGSKFKLGNDAFVPVGFNAYWLGLTESYTYPTHEQIEEMFILAQKMKATVIRSHTLGISSGSRNTLMNSSSIALNKAAWEPIDYAFLMAKKYNIKIIAPLTDTYKWYNGSYGDFCNLQKVDKTQFWTNLQVRSEFKNYINQWLNHVNQYTNVAIKNDPNLMMIELGNELGNIRPESESTTVPTEEWIRDISRYIKSIDKNHLVLDGADECLGNSNNFNIESIDCYSAHFYWEDYTRLDVCAKGANNVRKPYIIGEYSGYCTKSWLDNIESRPNVKGSIFWNVYPHQNGFNGGEPVAHDDGFTLHYPENYDQLLMLSNHFRRMQKIQETTNLN